MADTVKYPTCKRAFTHLAELGNVRSLGLALMGTCPNCGREFGVNILWVKTGETIYTPEEKQPARAEKYTQAHFSLSFGGAYG